MSRYEILESTLKKVVVKVFYRNDVPDIQQEWILKGYYVKWTTKDENHNYTICFQIKECL